MYFCWATVGFVVPDLDALLQPLLLLGFEDVGVLHADVAAVGVAQHRQHVAQLLELLPANPSTLNSRSRSHSVSRGC